jgi:hypothetical protein
MHTEMSSETHHSINTDDDHNTCDTSDEDPQPAKRRKLHSAPAVTLPLHLQRSDPLRSTSTTRPEIDDPRPQVDHGCPSTFVDNNHQHASRTSRILSVASEAVPVAEYQEWPFQGFLKRIRIGDDVTYNLEFKLPLASEHLHLLINSAALDTCSSKEAPAKAPTPHEAAAHSKIRQALLQLMKKRKHVKWTTEEDATLLQMRNDGRSWEEIAKSLPHRTPKTIQVHFSTSRAGVGEADVSSGQQQKRRRGRPRKQT